MKCADYQISTPPSLQCTSSNGLCTCLMTFVPRLNERPPDKHQRCHLGLLKGKQPGWQVGEVMESCWALWVKGLKLLCVCRERMRWNFLSNTHKRTMHKCTQLVRQHLCSASLPITALPLAGRSIKACHLITATICIQPKANSCMQPPS